MTDINNKALTALEAFTEWANAEYDPTPDPRIPQHERFASYWRCWQAALAQQSAQQEQDRIDAERYRWLRDNRESDWTICLWDGFEYIRGGLTPEIIDAGIDAARKGGRNG